MPEVEAEKNKPAWGGACPWGVTPLAGGAPSTPWGVPADQGSAPISLAEVMSEELADHLQKKEFKVLEQPSAVPPTVPDIPPDVDFDTSDDLLIAQMLQKQFDQEYDSALGKEERNMNRNSKVTVSYSKYRRAPEARIWDDSDEELDDVYFTQDDSKRDVDVFETREKELGDMPRCGFKMIGGKMVTKHDKEINHRENAKRIMEFPPGIETGDGGGFDMQLSNKVYNKIKNFSVKEGKRKNRVGDKEDKAVAEQAVDPQTRLLLYKFVNGGVLDSINGVISTGKEAVIMHADGGPGPERDTDEPMNVPKECAVKVFKTTLNEFKTRDKYIRDDYRFKDRFSKQNPRKVIHMWAEKELHNLAKMAKGGIRVPEIVVLKKHVLIMSFIGREGRPAPKLKDAAEHMSAKDLNMAYQQVVEMMEQLYTVCHLVHADLSEYNILWYEKEAWFIDVSQAVEPIHPSGLDFLLRDCTNVHNFFSKRGVDCLEPHELFSAVSGLEVAGGTEAEIVCQIRNYQKSQAAQTHTSKGGLEDEDNFEYCWEHSKDKTVTPSRPIPGHTKPKPAAKSPKSPKIPGLDCSRSPKTPGSDYSKSPKSPVSDIVGLTDDGLRKLKISLLTDSPDSDADIIQPRKPSQIKFSDQSEFETVDPDVK
jgi:RIO kinase 3